MLNKIIVCLFSSLLLSSCNEDNKERYDGFPYVEVNIENISIPEIDEIYFSKDKYLYIDNKISNIKAEDIYNDIIRNNQGHIYYISKKKGYIYFIVYIKKEEVYVYFDKEKASKNILPYLVCKYDGIDHKIDYPDDVNFMLLHIENNELKIKKYAEIPEKFNNLIKKLYVIDERMKEPWNGLPPAYEFDF